MPAAVESDVQVGAGHIYGLATIVIAIASGSLAGGTVQGYISPNIKSMRMVHMGTIDRIKNQAGLTSSIIGNDDALECAFDFIPEGASRALSKGSAAIPLLASPVSVTGCPVISMGPWADALNSVGNFGALQNNPWIYEGGGTLNGSDDTHWTGSFTLRRYQGILTPTVITG